MGITGSVGGSSGRRGVLGGGSGRVRVLRILGRKWFLRRVGFDGRETEAERIGLTGLAVEWIGCAMTREVAQCAPAIGGSGKERKGNAALV